VVSGSLSHAGILHLFFNMTSLWSCRSLEIIFGSLFYVKYSFLLLYSSSALILLFYWVLIRYGGREHYRQQVSVGYSCVVFGWMTILSQLSATSSVQLFGFVQLPLSLAPFASLLFTSLLIRQASFVGHLSGICIGYLIAWNELFEWNLFSNRTFVDCMLWSTVAMLWSVRRTTSALDKWIELHEDIQARGQINRDGVLTREREIRIDMSSVENV
jgi:membrane associated rhomboid family serine protease